MLPRRSKGARILSSPNVVDDIPLHSIFLRYLDLTCIRPKHSPLAFDIHVNLPVIRWNEYLPPSGLTRIHHEMFLKAISVHSLLPRCAMKRN